MCLVGGWGLRLQRGTRWNTLAQSLKWQDARQSLSRRFARTARRNDARGNQTDFDEPWTIEGRWTRPSNIWCQMASYDNYKAEARVQRSLPSLQACSWLYNYIGATHSRFRKHSPSRCGFEICLWLFPVSNHGFCSLSSWPMESMENYDSLLKKNWSVVTAGGTCATTCPSFVDVAGALEFCGGRSESDFKARDRKCRFERTDWLDLEPKPLGECDEDWEHK